MTRRRRLLVGFPRGAAALARQHERPAGERLGGDGGRVVGTAFERHGTDVGIPTRDLERGRSRRDSRSDRGSAPVDRVGSERPPAPVDRPGAAVVGEGEQGGRDRTQVQVAAVGELVGGGGLAPERGEHPGRRALGPRARRRRGTAPGAGGAAQAQEDVVAVQERVGPVADQLVASLGRRVPAGARHGEDVAPVSAAACSAVIRAPPRTVASTTTVMSASTAMIRFRTGTAPARSPTSRSSWRPPSAKGSPDHGRARAGATGADVFAVPGSRRNPAAEGCNELIHDGAHPLLHSDDVLLRLGCTPGSRGAVPRHRTRPPRARGRGGPGCSPRSGASPPSPDQLAHRCDLDLGAVSDRPARPLPRRPRPAGRRALVAALTRPGPRELTPDRTGSPVAAPTFEVPGRDADICPVTFERCP